MVLKLKLEGETVVFRPASTKSKTRWRAEVAASRLAKAWGLHEVLQSDAWTIPCALIKAKITVTEILCDAHEMAHGAATGWISGLTFPAFEEADSRKRIRESLSATSMSTIDTERARSFSRMALFDYVIGNWDRWSGGNVGELKGAIVFVDHDAAFYEPAPPALGGARRALVDTDRFSREFVTALRGSVDDLGTIVGKDDANEPLLTASQIDAARGRALEALRIISTKRARLGGDVVMSFR